MASLTKFHNVRVIQIIDEIGEEIAVMQSESISQTKCERGRRIRDLSNRVNIQL